MRVCKKNIGIFIFILCLVPGLSHAQEMAVPIDIQYSLITKILAFDRNLDNRSYEKIVIGIVYQRKYRVSLLAKEKLEKTFDNSEIKQIANIPIEIKSLDLSDMASLSRFISENKVNVLYVTPLRAASIQSISEMCRKNKVISFTGVPEYVNDGLSVGIASKGGKPIILVNLEAAKAEGANFSARFLKLVEIIE